MSHFNKTSQKNLDFNFNEYQTFLNTIKLSDSPIFHKISFNVKKNDNLRHYFALLKNIEEAREDVL